MSLDFSDSFSDLSNWEYNGSSCFMISSGAGRSPVLAQSPGSVSGNLMRRYYWTRTSTVGVHIELSIPSVGTGTSQIMTIDSGTYIGWHIGMVQYPGAGRVHFFCGATDLGYVPVTLDGWTTLDILVNIGSSGSLQVWVDGGASPALAWTGNTQNDPLTTNAYGVRFNPANSGAPLFQNLQVYRPSTVPAYSPLAVPTGSPVLSMAPEFTETFSSLSAWTVTKNGGGVTTEMQPGVSGAVDCLEFGSGGSSAGEFSAYRDTTSAVCYGLRFQAMSPYPGDVNSNNSFLFLQSPSGAGTQIMVFQDATNSRLQIYRGAVADAGHLLVSMPYVSMPLGEWVSVDLYVRVGTTGSLYVWMAGKPVCLVDGVNTLGDATHPTIGRVVIADETYPNPWQYLANLYVYQNDGVRRARSHGYFQGV
jgi:hypothetical protein